MPRAVLCREPSELQRFTLGLLPEPEAEPLGQHLLACPHCAETLNNLRAKDTLLDALRGNFETPPPELPAVEALMDRLARTPPPLTVPGAVAYQNTDEAMPGQIGRYQIRGRLGAGGMGTVYRAYDAQLCRDVAIKVPRFEGPKEAVVAARQRFLREARAAAAVRNPHVCPIYDVSEQDGRPYVVMALVEGCSLAERLKEKPLLEWREAVALVGQVAEALAAVHAAGIIHRDLKLGNILLDRNGQALLTDFGLARAERDHEHLTPQDALLGTPSYMAPEQALGGTVDARSDLFSLGVVLYELCTGQLPFRGNSPLAVLNELTTTTPVPPAQFNPAVPTGLSNLVQQLLAKNPAERPASARAVAERLEALARQPSVQTAADSAAFHGPSTRNKQPTVRSRPLRRRLLLTGLAVLLILMPLGFLYGGAIVRIVTNKGELIIETSDPDVEVTVKGNSATVYDKAKGRRFVLTAGDYEVEVREAGEGGVRFDTKRFTITRGGKETFNAVLKPKEKPDDGKREGPTTKPLSPDEIKGDERKAAEWVLSIGGTVMVNEEEREIKAAADLPPKPFRLTSVNFENKQVSEEGLAHFKGCKNLASLRLNGTQVTEKGLANFKACNNLRHLDLAYTQVNDEGLAHFGDCKNLNSLSLWDAPLVSDRGLANFKDCKNLTYIALRPTQGNKAGLVYFKNCKEVRNLTLNGPQVTDVELVYFKECKNLTKVNLNNTKVGDKALAQFKDCTNLSDLELNSTKATDACLQNFKDLTNLETLTLDDTQVSNEGLVKLKDCKNLKYLCMGNTRADDLGLANIKDCNLLTFVNLEGTQVTDAGLVYFKDCKNLSYLNLKNTKVTAARIGELKKALPNCNIEI